MADKKRFIINDSQDFDKWFNHEIFYGVSDNEQFMYPVIRYKDKYMICSQEIKLSFPWVIDEELTVSSLTGAANYLKLCKVNKFRLTQCAEESEDLSLTGLKNLKYLTHSELIALL